MSRIHDILAKAEREGSVRRTHAAAAPQPMPIVPPPVTAHTPMPAAEPRACERQPRPGRLIEAGQMSPLLVAALAPHVDIAEQYRTLRTRIVLGEDGRPRRALLVTSPAKGDGKTVTATNLALTMAQEFNRRIVLVDADLREPAVHTLLGLPRSPGLSEVLAGSLPLDEALVELPEFNLTVLPAGAEAERPAEQLGSSGMRHVLDALRTRFDRVLVDVPPIVPLADVSVLAPQVDGVLLVVRAGATTKPAIEKALSVVDANRLLGIVLNGTDGARPPYATAVAHD
jgi:capsular exopolysaccharide synthesis family protein